MAKLGGTTSLGRQFILGGEPYGLRPSFVINRILVELSRFLYDDNTKTGFLRTLTRLTGPLDDAEVEKLIGDRATPAMFVHYGGGVYSNSDKIPRSTGGASWMKTAVFSVVCVADDYRDRVERLEGKTIHEPGLDNMVAMAAHYAGIALANVRRLKNARPVNERYTNYRSQHFVGMIQFEGEMETNWRADASTIYLERLGICHSPRISRTLFETDNITPATDDPTSPTTGVADVTGDDV